MQTKTVHRICCNSLPLRPLGSLYANPLVCSSSGFLPHFQFFRGTFLMLDRVVAFMAITILSIICTVFGYILIRSIIVLVNRFNCRTWIQVPLQSIEMSFYRSDDSYFKVKSHYRYVFQGKMFEGTCAFIGADVDGVTMAEKQMLELRMTSRMCFVSPQDHSKSVLDYKVASSLRVRIFSCLIGLAVIAVLISIIVFKPFPAGGFSPFIPASMPHMSASDGRVL